MKTVIRTVKYNYTRTKCDCGGDAVRHQKGFVRTVAELGISGPTFLRISYSKYRCKACNAFFCPSMDHFVFPGHRYSRRVEKTAVAFLKQHGYRTAHDLMWDIYFVKIPPSTIYEWYVAQELAALGDYNRADRRDLLRLGKKAFNELSASFDTSGTALLGRSVAGVRLLCS